MLPIKKVKRIARGSVFNISRQSAGRGVFRGGLSNTSSFCLSIACFLGCESNSHYSYWHSERLLHFFEQICRVFSADTSTFKAGNRFARRVYEIIVFCLVNTFNVMELFRSLHVTRMRRCLYENVVYLTRIFCESELEHCKGSVYR